MDPDECLKQIRATNDRITDAIDANRRPDPGDVDKLVDLTTALDGWMTRGGFLPKQWMQPRKK